MKKSIADVPLVQEDQLIAVIDLLKGSLTDQQIAFIKNRWLHQVIYWDQRSREARYKYFILRSLTVLGSVAIPVFASLALTYSSRKEFSVSL